MNGRPSTPHCSSRSVSGISSLPYCSSRPLSGILPPAFVITLLFLLTTLLMPLIVIADVTVDATLSTNRITVGDRVTVTITASHPPDQRIVVPPFERDPVIIVYHSDTQQRDNKDGSRQTTAQYVISSFVIGEHRVSTNGILVLQREGREELMPFPGLVLQVDSVLTNPPPALADIKPAIPFPGNRWLRIMAMIIAVIIIATLLAFLLRWWLRRRPVDTEKVRTLPPHEIALSALNALLQRRLIEQGEAQAFYVELSAIVRIYLEDRFNLRAPEQTTEEFIRTSSQSSSLSLDHRTLTQAFLEQSDLVKFARFEPSPDDMRSAWDAAAQLVRETIPPPAVNGGAP